MKCTVCGHEAQKVFTGQILNAYNVGYFFCPYCEHLQTEEPFWLDEAYKNPIANEDTGILKRNMDNAVYSTGVICSFYDTKGKFLDYGGGYGVFVRLMRDIGFDFYFYDKYSKNLFAPGFEHKENDKAGLVFGLEILEHLYNPIETLDKIFKISEDFFFSQTLLPLPVPDIHNWWYYAPVSGQHISFYRNKTLDFIADMFNKKHLNYKDLHLFTSKNITGEDFKISIKNSSLIYAENVPKFKSKIYEDMQYIIKNKKPAE